MRTEKERSGELLVFPKGEATLSCVTSVAIECGDCGHSRWRKPNEFYRAGFKASTVISEIGEKLYCSQCRQEGLPGKNIVIQAAFSTEKSDQSRSVPRNQRVRAAG
jgi:hypothetical protein